MNEANPLESTAHPWCIIRGWKATTVQANRRWRLQFSGECIQGLRRAIDAGLLRNGGNCPPQQLFQSIPGLKELIEAVELELDSGFGFAVISGLDRLFLSPRDFEALALHLGRCVGTPVSQNRQEEYVVKVQDEGLSAASRTVRGHQTNAALPFHCDRTDRIMLLCLRNALVGGESELVSSLAVWDFIEKARPDLFKVLCADFPHDRRGEENPGEEPWCQMPIFSRVGSARVTRYIRRFIDSSQILDTAPRLEPIQREALDYFDRTINDPKFKIKLEFNVGDIQLVNNHVVLHARSAFSDSAEAGSGRLLLRVWLSHKSSCPLPESFVPIYNSVEPGSMRGGVWPIKSNAVNS